MNDFGSSGGRWLNVTNDQDVVALHARLDSATLLDGIDNH